MKLILISILLLSSAALFGVDVLEGEDGTIKYIYTSEENEEVLILLDENDFLTGEVLRLHDAGVVCETLNQGLTETLQTCETSRSVLQKNTFYWVVGTAIIAPLLYELIKGVIQNAIQKGTL